MTSTSNNKYDAIIINRQLLDSAGGLLEGINDLANRKIFSQGNTIFSHGDNASAIWFVVNGWVKLSRHTPDGKEAIIALCSEGDAFGEAALFPDSIYTYNAEIVGGRAELAVISSGTIREKIAGDKKLSARIMSILHKRTMQAETKLEHMNTMSAAQRLGCFILRLCHSQTDGERTIIIPVEKNILASYLGMKPETLSRSQQQLKTIGVDVSGDQVKISDIEKLKQFVCDSCSGYGGCSLE